MLLSLCAAAALALPASASPAPPPPWPLPEPEVARGFAPPPVRWAAGHRGVDLAGRPGQPVRTVAAGRVVHAGPVAGRGVVSVELAGTGPPPLRVTYEPVRASVRVGERVAAGAVVGTLTPGGSHCPPRACLHWGLRQGERYLDPLSLLATGPPVLLPVFGVPLPGTAAPGGAPPAPAETAVATAAATAGQEAADPVVSPAWQPAAARTGPAGLALPGVLAVTALWAAHRLRRRKPAPAGRRGRLPGPVTPAPHGRAGRARGAAGRRAVTGCGGLRGGPWRRPPR
ncbi:M23 family metallopeptidase [Streptomyces sp. TRM 70351]|uniref:murein hydrolase activator EnvC family protein n=1 Tax=Streptomyces sp. TRM 70351 TaxID=3116552 RepID=UPI002E7C4E35|nr:M23 family metallopeptidase [Streptomyces sp. TRM 70351]MEE1931128.1 M23 family metallopeptidase [Streptomyces sp. TRM 70351]